MGIFSKMSKQYKVLMSMLLTIVLLIAVQLAIWKVVKVSADALQQERFQERQIENVEKRNVEIKEKFDTQQRLLDQLDVIIPKVTSLTQVVERIEQLADMQSLPMTITKIDKSGSDEKKNVNIVPMTLTVQVKGTVEKLMMFISQIEHIQELTIVRSWDISPSGASENTAIGSITPYTMSIEVSFFLQEKRND